LRRHRPSRIPMAPRSGAGRAMQSHR
jgi:hypothetical protein